MKRNNKLSADRPVRLEDGGNGRIVAGFYRRTVGAAVIMLLLAAVCLSGCGRARSGPAEETSDRASTVTLYGYDHLFNDAERELYRTIDRAVRETVPSDFQADGSIGMDRVAEIIDIYSLDHPEAFWIDEELNLEQVQTDDGSAYRLRYRQQGDALIAQQHELNDVVDRFLALIPPDAAPFDKEVLINDFLIDLCEYDKEAASDDAYCAKNEINAYGAFIDRLANCEGYAKAAKLLLDRVGIDNVLILGLSTDESRAPHIWNAVLLDGGWYYLDVTNNDVGHENPFVRHYLYFNVDSAFMEKYYTPDGVYGGAVDQDLALHNSFVPECRSTEYNYFVRTCETLDPAEEDVLIEKVAGAVSSGKEAYMFIVSEDADFDACWTRLYTEGDYARICRKANEINGREPEIDTERTGVYFFRPYRVISFLFAVSGE